MGLGEESFAGEAEYENATETGKELMDVLAFGGRYKHWADAFGGAA